MCSRRCIRVLHGQAVNRCNRKCIGILVLGNGDLDFMLSRLFAVVCVVIHAVRSAVFLGDRVSVGSGLIKLNLTKCGGRISCGLVYGALFPDGCFRPLRIFWHWSIVLCSQMEGEAVSLRPVIEILGDAQALEHRRKGIRDGKRLLAIVPHNRAQCICGIRRLRYRNQYLMCCCIIGNTIQMIVCLRDLIFVGSCLRVGDLTKDCLR